VVAFIVNVVFVSINLLFFKSTDNPNFERKSAPIIGRFTDAITNGKIKSLLSPRFNLRVLFPYVFIIEPFAAVSNISGSFL